MITYLQIEIKRIDNEDILVIDESITYLKTTMTKFKKLNSDLESEIISERQQFMAEKKKRNYNANIKFIIKNWNLS